jgi:hypothetical protein
MYSVPRPTPRYDIFPKDFVHPSYAGQLNGQFNGQFNVGSEEPVYPQYSFNEVLAPAFQDPNSSFYHQAPNGGLLASAFQQNGYAFNGGPARTFQQNGYTFGGGPAPAFQYQMSPFSGHTPGSSSQLSSSSFETTLTPPGPSLESILQQFPQAELQENILQPPSAEPAPVTSGRRTRGPNRRPPGTGFTDLLVRFISFHLVSESSPYWNGKHLAG